MISPEDGGSIPNRTFIKVDFPAPFLYQRMDFPFFRLKFTSLLAAIPLPDFEMSFISKYSLASVYLRPVLGVLPVIGAPPVMGALPAMGVLPLGFHYLVCGDACGGGHLHFPATTFIFSSSTCFLSFSSRSFHRIHFPQSHCVLCNTKYFPGAVRYLTLHGPVHCLDGIFRNVLDGW